MRSAHMNIQQKFLCLAAYEGFVLKTSTVNIEQQLALVLHVGINVNSVKGCPMLSSHTTNKEVMKQNILYPIGYSIILMLYSYMVII